jgi:hypothetical protein
LRRRHHNPRRYDEKAVAAEAEYTRALEEYNAARADGKREAQDDGGGRGSKRARGQYLDVCSLCEEPGLLLECSGTCYCSYHPFCIGISVIPEGDFLCDACVTGNQRCFVCDDTGVDLRKCDHARCHKW